MRTSHQGASKVKHTQQRGSRRRRGLAVAAAVGATALTGIVVLRHAPTPPSTQTTSMTFPNVRVVTPSRVVDTTSPGTAGLRAYIDPTTGQFREPEQEELQAAAAEAEGNLAFARVAGNQKQSVRGAAGGQGVALGLEYDANLVATVGPDGKVTYGHAQGATRGARAVAAGVATKEARDDR